MPTKYFYFVPDTGLWDVNPIDAGRRRVYKLPWPHLEKIVVHAREAAKKGCPPYLLYDMEFLKWLKSNDQMTD